MTSEYPLHREYPPTGDTNQFCLRSFCKECGNYRRRQQLGETAESFPKFEKFTPCRRCGVNGPGEHVIARTIPGYLGWFDLYDQRVDVPAHMKQCCCKHQTDESAN